MDKKIIAAFRAEIRCIQAIKPNSEVLLVNDPNRTVNTRAAIKLLKHIFFNRIKITLSSKGFLCGSKEEYVLNLIRSYTVKQPVNKNMLLSSLSLDQIKTITGEKPYIPLTPETKFMNDLITRYPSIINAR